MGQARRHADAESGVVQWQTPADVAKFMAAEQKEFDATQKQNRADKAASLQDGEGAPPLGQVGMSAEEALIAKLDETDPDWRSKIDKDQLAEALEEKDE
jgi:hypothetical protein